MDRPRMISALAVAACGRGLHDGLGVPTLKPWT
jgi:hypothetical protein